MCRVWMIHFWMVKNHYPDRVMRQFNLFPTGFSAGSDRLPASADVSQEQAHIRMWRMTKYGLGTILLLGTGWAQAAYHGVTTVRLCPALCKWDDITREGWLQSGTKWTLRSTWVSHYRTPKSLHMSWHTYHIHTRMPERLAFNEIIYSYLNSSHNLCYRIKNIYADVPFSNEYSYRHWLS
jgi:hypothetical protein